MIFGFSALLACQAQPTKTGTVLGGTEHGFLPPPILKESMQNLKQNLVMLQPYIFDQKKFNKPSSKTFLSKQIHKLAVDAQNVKHDPVILSKDPTARFVAAQFAIEIKSADENYAAGWHDYSRTQLMKVTSYCLECHTRLKDGVEIRLKDSIEPYVNTLSIKDQIEFMIAFRQFESAYKIALNEIKKVFTHAELQSDLDQIAKLGLLISVQYMNDISKALSLTDAIDKNRSSPSFLKERNKNWKKSLARWSPDESLSKFSEIRILKQSRLSEIEDMRLIPALLNLLTGNLSLEELSEALLLTGESYESLNGISFLSLHESYYKSCIWNGPKTKWAKTCFNRYENSVTLSYTGSGGTRVPPDVRVQLQRLKKEIE